jgi:two-component system phosphate regulon sensor histidine kinase PhoR
VRSHRNLLARLLAPYLFALLAVAVSLYLYGDRLIEQLYVNTLAEEVLRQARLAGALLPWDVRGSEMDGRCAEVGGQIAARVTVITSDGQVIGDSDAPSATLENHRDRPEVRAALAGGDGSAVRVSASVNRPLFYRAWKQTRGTGATQELRIVRLAVPMATIDGARHRIRTAIGGGILIAALAALWPTLRITRRLSVRIGRLSAFSHAVTAGHEPPSLGPERDDVIGALEGNLVTMANSLHTQLQSARSERATLATVLSGMVEGVLVIDRAAVIRLANQRATEIFATCELVGQPLLTVSRDPDLQALMRMVMHQQAPAHHVHEITFNGGRREHFRISATPLNTAPGAPELFVLVFHDVTELKKLETARRDFVANVSHELRTPLTAIRGYAETLRAGALADPEVARKFLGVIERHSERLTRLTDDLLTLSDLELGRAALHRMAVALPAVVEAAIEVIREKAQQGQVVLRTEVDAAVPPLDADPDRLEQVLVNLLDNAVKYTPAGGTVTLAVRRGDTPDAVEITVTDTGIGIPSEDLPRLTERFYRVDKARSRELGGTGLGLAIVKHIVQAHGGTLRFESEVGGGTTVRVTLSCADTQHD